MCKFNVSPIVLYSFHLDLSADMIYISYYDLKKNDVTIFCLRTKSFNMQQILKKSLSFFKKLEYSIPFVCYEPEKNPPTN